MSSISSSSSGSMQSISIADGIEESSPQSESFFTTDDEDEANIEEIQRAKQLLLQHQYDLFPNKSVGNGSYGKVYLVKHLVEKKLYVAKIVTLDRKQDSYTQLKQMVREIRILKILRNHPNIVKLKAVFSDYKAAPSYANELNDKTPPSYNSESKAAPSYVSESNDKAPPSYTRDSNGSKAAAPKNETHNQRKRCRRNHQ